jgi:uncharacterized protein (TIGR03546 family)
MTLLLKQLFNFIKLLNSDKGTHSIAAGVVCGMFLGFTPAFSLQTIFVILVLFFFRIQIGAATISAAFFKILAYALDPLFDVAGRSVLEIDALNPLYTSLYNMPIVPMTRFNNSIVMGSGVIALLLSPFVYYGAKALIFKYREVVVTRIRGTAIWKAFTASTFYGWYQKYESFTGN